MCPVCQLCWKLDLMFFSICEVHYDCILTHLIVFGAFGVLIMQKCELVADWTCIVVNLWGRSKTSTRLIFSKISKTMVQNDAVKVL